MSVPSIRYEAIKCRCGLVTCTGYQVVGLDPSFKVSKRMAFACADLLNQMAKTKKACEITVKVMAEDREGFR
jgi:hypothetical protein